MPELTVARLVRADDPELLRLLGVASRRVVYRLAREKKFLTSALAAPSNFQSPPCRDEVYAFALRHGAQDFKRRFRGVDKSHCRLSRRRRAIGEYPANRQYRASLRWDDFNRPLG